MRFKSWKTPVAIAVATIAALGTASPAMAIDTGDATPNPSAATPESTEKSLELPEDVWQTLIGHLPQDVQVLAKLRGVSSTFDTQVMFYLKQHPDVWRLQPAEVLEKILKPPITPEAPTAPQEWKDAINVHVLIPDVVPSEKINKYDWTNPDQRTRVARNQQELDVALAETRYRTITLMGDAAFDVSKSGQHKLRLLDSVQVHNVNDGTVIAYNKSQVRNVTGSSAHTYVYAFDEAQIHGVNIIQGADDWDHFGYFGTVTAMDNSQIHGVTDGSIAVYGNVKVHNVANGHLEVFGKAEVHNPTGGRITCYGPDPKVINPGAGATITRSN